MSSTAVKHVLTPFPPGFACCPIQFATLQFLTQRDLYRFPYFTTFSLDYSESAVRMLSQMSTAVIRNAEVQKHIQELVASARKKKNSREQNVI